MVIQTYMIGQLLACISNVMRHIFFEMIKLLNDASYFGNSILLCLIKYLFLDDYSDLFSTVKLSTSILSPGLMLAPVGIHWHFELSLPLGRKRKSIVIGQNHPTNNFIDIVCPSLSMELIWRKEAQIQREHGCNMRQHTCIRT